MGNNPLNVIAQDPADAEAENAVIGCVLIDQASLAKVSDNLVPDDFYNRLNDEIFDVMLQLEDKGCPIDILIVSKELDKKKIQTHDAIVSHLTDCVNSVPSSSHIKQYAKDVKEKSALRAIIKTATAIQEMGREDNADAEDLLDVAERGLFNISIKRGKKKYYEIKDIVGGSVDKLKKIMSGEIQPGIMTGLKELDDIIAGLHPSDLIIIGARPSLGKSAIAMNLAYNISVQNKSVAIFSLEMDKTSLSDRLISIKSGLSLHGIRTGTFSGHKTKAQIIAEAEEAQEYIKTLPILIEDTPVQSVMEIKRACRRIKAEHKDLSLVIVDYLQLIRPRKDDGKTNDQVSEISKGLKALARELEVPVLALSQLSRNIEMRESSTPRLSDLRDSGALEQDADVVIFISRGNDMGDGEPPVELIVAKHRNGPLGVAKVKWNKETASFS
jgi:replicative DNA helicase